MSNGLFLASRVEVFRLLFWPRLSGVRLEGCSFQEAFTGFSSCYSLGLTALLKRRQHPGDCGVPRHDRALLCCVYL